MSDSSTGAETKSKTFVCTQRTNDGNSYDVGQDTQLGKWSMALGQIMCVRPQNQEINNLELFFFSLIHFQILCRDDRQWVGAPTKVKGFTNGEKKWTKLITTNREQADVYRLQLAARSYVVHSTFEH